MQLAASKWNQRYLCGNKKYRIVITGKKTRKEKELNTMPARKKCHSKL